MPTANANTKAAAETPAETNLDPIETNPRPAKTVYLLDAAGGLEEKILLQWIAEQTSEKAPDTVALPSSRRPNKNDEIDAKLEQALASGSDVHLKPIRLAWLPPQSDDARPPGLLSLLVFGDPHDPGRIRQQWIRRRDPDRCRVVDGQSATVGELRKRWHSGRAGLDEAETAGLADFVIRQAHLALDRAERKIRGLRYKVPRFVADSISDRPSFRGGVAKLAWESGSNTATIGHDAGAYLKEIAATHSPYIIDLTAHLCRALYTRGYGDNLHYDRGDLESVYALAQQYPVVFLPSHKSNLDHLVLQYALYENGHPPNHTAGGINMNFFPIGSLLRRSGVFFIRRTFKDNAVYKFVLGQYIDYLIEKRFPLEWYIEGGRSRSGKLLPPRYGLLAYVIDAYKRGRSEDVILLPVSTVYDQIQDVGDYAAEQRGAEKQSESFGWLLRVVGMLRGGYGGIHIRFGEPISLRESLGQPAMGQEPQPDEKNIDVRKMAFEVSHRINAVTPITPTSLVTLALLGAGDRAVTLAEAEEAIAPFVEFVRSRGLPTTETLNLESPEGVRATLDGLIRNNVVSCFDKGPEAVYAINKDQHLSAAYYRNATIHFFVTAAISELALVALRHADSGVDREALFWEEIAALRDLLKFEFFFADKEESREQIAGGLAKQSPDWQGCVEAGGEDLRRLMQEIRPLTAHLVLRPFLEAYQVVGDTLERIDSAEAINHEAVLSDCLALGTQYHLQKRIRNAESVSKVLFASALKLADNRELLGPADEKVREARAAFAEEIRTAVRRVDAIDAIAAGRRAGLDN